MLTSNGIRQRPPWRQARWAVPAAVLLVALIAAALVVLTGPGGSGPHNATATSGSHSASGGGGTAQATGCTASDSRQSIPTAPPSDLVWKNVGALLVPTSDASGPTRIDGPVWSCYAHTPMGAVMAAYAIFATLTSPGWHTVAEREIAPGPGRQAFIAAGLSQPYQPLSPQHAAQPAGFAVVTYTPAQATIETLSDAGSGQFQTDQRTVAWVGGDWKLVMTPDGTIGPDPQVVSSANGFVLWGH